MYIHMIMNYRNPWRIVLDYTYSCVTLKKKKYARIVYFNIKIICILNEAVQFHLL